MKKFFLVDPSFDGTSGDKWQYALAFARAANRNGYQFFMLSSEGSPEMPLVEGAPVIQRPIFRHAFYQHDRIVARHLEDPTSTAARLFSIKAKRELDRVRQDLHSADHAGDLGRKLYLDAAQKEKELELMDAARRLAEAEMAGSPILFRPFNEDDFAKALAKELSEHSLESGDILFFHTMTPAMLESFSELALHRAESSTFDVDAYCLFHFGFDAPDAKTFLDRYYSYSHFESLKLRLQNGCPFRRLHLLATSATLAMECEAIFGLHFGVFHGLVNLDDYLSACGGSSGLTDLREALSNNLHRDSRLGILARAGDLDLNIARELRLGLLLLLENGFRADFSILFHKGTLHLLRDLLEVFADVPYRLVCADANHDYISALARANFVILPYDQKKYEKRVSAVLHDCAVLGVPCIVPEGTTLADGGEYATIWPYIDLSDLPAAMLNAAKVLAKSPTVALGQIEKMKIARRIYAGDVIDALLASTTAPSLCVHSRGPVAAVYMPAWGRCGSSYAMESQIRYLLLRGFFVVQILIMDQAVDPSRVTPWLWRLLRENSQGPRGTIQRIAFATYAEMSELEESAFYSSCSAFEQLLQRIALADPRDTSTDSLLSAATISIVNHVFNSRFALKYIRGARVLETHDIQAIQLHARPLRNSINGLAEPLPSLLRDEFHELGVYDHIVNVAPNEHAMLSLANPRSTMITLYVSVGTNHRTTRALGGIHELVDAWGLDPIYRKEGRFDLLLIGDAHNANVDSANWFMESVYRPHLQAVGIKLAIAGRLSDALHARFGAQANVFYLGFVPDPHAVRTLCDIAVLPDIKGTGISIKALETFAAGQAFVATAHSVRGFGTRLPPDFPCASGALEFLDQINVLLADKQHLRDREATARLAYELLSDSTSFDEAWDQILAALPETATQPAVD